MSSITKSKHTAMIKTIVFNTSAIAAAALVARTVTQNFLLPKLHHYSNQITMVIDEFDGLSTNEIYGAAEIYLGSKISSNTRLFKVKKPQNENAISVGVEKNQEVVDSFNGAEFKWVFLCHQIPNSAKPINRNDDMNLSMKLEVRSFELKFQRENRALVLDSYLPYILKEAKNEKQKMKKIKIFTVDANKMFDCTMVSWKSLNFQHPMTFDTLVMEEELKQGVIKDLEMFLESREKYRKIGKVWRRGYFIYGPPGAGKSSLVAAMANFLNFDVYEFEFGALKSEWELKKLLMTTGNQSILVVEDIGLNFTLADEDMAKSDVQEDIKCRPQDASKVTLSGFLNLIDGLWSSCGDERIIIFTTTNKDKINPTLLCAGRMDYKIHMSYCTPTGFRLLALNHLGLGIENHPHLGDIEELMKIAQVTPGQVARRLYKSNDPEESVTGLMTFLKDRREERNKEQSAKLERHK